MHLWSKTSYIEVQNQVKYGSHLDFFCHAVFGNFSTPKTKSDFGIKVQNWINLSSGTDFLSLPKLLTEIWPFKPHFWDYFHFHGFSWGHLHTFFHFCIFAKTHDLKTFIILYSIRFRRVENIFDWVQSLQTESYWDYFHGKLVKLATWFWISI